LGPDLEVQRVNDDEADRIGALSVTGDSIVFEVDGVDVNASELTTVWYRKGRHWLCNLYRASPIAHEPALSLHMETKLRMEETRLSQYVHEFIQLHGWCLGSADKGDLNKLTVLGAAASVGLRVPRFLVSSSTRALAAEVGSVPSVTKAISDGLYLFDDTLGSRGFYSYTERVTREDLEDLPMTISPSLVQEEIRKRFDVRVFYLEGRIWAMAIFSQNDVRTQVDFRKYNDACPNRTVPYRLPQEIETRLDALFQALDLKTGSADLVVDEEGEHVFLEINPVGQFGMVSEPCNYYLERDVARTLVAHERH
jgi:ATP-GRASP peptide maturase of grasp-with-spasm system